MASLTDRHIPGTHRERVESLLHGGLVALEPALGAVRLDILAPHGSIAVDGVAGDAEDGAGREELAEDGEATLWHDAGEADGRRRVDAHALVDARIEVRQALDLVAGRDNLVLRPELLVELPVQLLLDVWVTREVVDDRAGGAKGGQTGVVRRQSEARTWMWCQIRR